MEYLLVILKCILLRLTSTVVTSIVWHVLPFLWKDLSFLNLPLTK